MEVVKEGNFFYCDLPDEFAKGEILSFDTLYGYTALIKNNRIQAITKLSEHGSAIFQAVVLSYPRVLPTENVCQAVRGGNVEEWAEIIAEQREDENLSEFLKPFRDDVDRLNKALAQGRVPLRLRTVLETGYLLMTTKKTTKKNR